MTSENLNCTKTLLQEFELKNCGRKIVSHNISQNGHTALKDSCIISASSVITFAYQFRLNKTTDVSH